MQQHLNLLNLTCPFAPDLKVMFVSIIEVSMVKIGLPVSSEYVRIASEERLRDFRPSILPSKI